jgi:hypothetical protein
MFSQNQLLGPVGGNTTIVSSPVFGLEVYITAIASASPYALDGKPHLIESL